MTTLKNKIIDEIIRVEGGFVDDPSDSGGKTNYGITEIVARSFGYIGRMHDLPHDVAYSIYVTRYWDTVRGDELMSLSERIVEEVVDTGVNMGVNRAGKFLQRSLNVLNNREKYYRDVVVDGLIGQGTLTALEVYLSKRDESTLVKMLNCLQGAFYVELAERREKDERFISGWFKNRVAIK
jgi:lysozyme family protein